MLIDLYIRYTRTNLTSYCKMEHALNYYIRFRYKYVHIYIKDSVNLIISIRDINKIVIRISNKRVLLTSNDFFYKANDVNPSFSWAKKLEGLFGWIYLFRLGQKQYRPNVRDKTLFHRFLLLHSP